MIRIAHLYPYELNLYGENGNVKAITYMLEKNNVPYELTNIDIFDEIDFNKYDLIYIGSGRKKYLDLVKKRLEDKKLEILKYISEDKVFLVTGNAISIFDFLGLYEVKYYEARKVSNVVGTTSLCKGVIKGFQNTEYLLDSTEDILFSLDSGFGNHELKLEGYQNHNFYATSIIGPILARNDNLCKFIVSEMLKLEDK